MENHTNKTYQERMNKTAMSKFSAIEKHLDKGVKLLDFGSGFSPEFIGQVKETGAQYVAYDVSHIVQQKLKENHIDFLTREELETVENEFDVIYLSSVFHELMSYLSRPERTQTFEMLDKALKPNGIIVIRDWGYATNNTYSLELTSKDVESEVQTWITELVKNSIIQKPRLVMNNDDKPVSPNIHLSRNSHDLYEIMFHAVWGLNSLERESKETYTIIPELIEKWICTPHNYEIVHQHEEYDETYLPHLQKYFKLDGLPWPTKIIYELKKGTSCQI